MRAPCHVFANRSIWLEQPIYHHRSIGYHVHLICLMHNASVLLLISVRFDVVDVIMSHRHSKCVIDLDLIAQSSEKA
jgi:hypothetical protein